MSALARVPKRAIRIRPVDRLIALYNAGLALLWGAVAVAGVPAARGAGLAFRLDPQLAGLLAVVHAVAAVLPTLLVRRHPRSLPRWLATLHDAYPLALLPLFWLELDPAIRTIHGTTWDGAILALDRAVFGFHLDRVWIRAMSQGWFSELMHFSYWIYLPLIFAPAIMTAVRRDRTAFQDVALRLLATYLGCYMIYLLMPSAGPKVFGVPFKGVAEGVFRNLVDRAHATGNVYGAAFPSSHVAGSVTVAWLAWRWLPRGVALLFSVQALGVLMSTVYTQNHYAIDSLAGLCFAIVVQAMVVPYVVRRNVAAGRRSRVAVPVLPLTVPPAAGGAA